MGWRGGGGCVRRKSYCFESDISTSIERTTLSNKQAACRLPSATSCFFFLLGLIFDLKMEAVLFFEASVVVYLSTWYYILQDGTHFEIHNYQSSLARKF
jgi:hypothetical protein